MWQRIQTLLLAVATGLIVSLFWCDVAQYVCSDGTVAGIRYAEHKICLVWIIILTVLQVISLGGFKWRMKQFRMVIVTLVMCLGFQGFLVYLFLEGRGSLIFSPTALFPFVAAVLDGFAARNILIDEALVQSAARLRLPRKKH